MRVKFIDLARSIAIIFAMFDHSMNDFNVWFDYSFTHYALLKSFTSAATPTFLFLFGMMLELVYYKKYQKNGLEGMVPKLVTRSLQCYRGYILIALAGLIGGVLTFNRTIAAVLFLSKTHYGNILKLYAVFMLLAIPILIIRKKVGIDKIFFASLCIWFIYPFYDFISISNAHLASLTSVLFGLGGQEGPSVLLSFSLVAAGMFLSSKISFEKPITFIRTSLVMLLISLTILVTGIQLIGVGEFIDLFYSNGFRVANHPIYYVYGLTVALCLSLLCFAIYPFKNPRFVGLESLMIFSKMSLEAFTYGNILLNLFYLDIKGLGLGLIGPVCFLFLLYALLRFLEYLIYQRKVELPFYRNLEGKIVSRVSTFLMRQINLRS